MKRFHVFLDEKTIKELKKLPGTVAGNIRVAVYEFLEKYKPDVSTSMSRKVGERKV